MKTFSAKESEVARAWLLVDATELPIGRVATKVASLLQGKHKPEFTKHVDTGDYVVIVNAEKIIGTGNKETRKVYYHHSGFPGGIKSRTLEEMRAKAPEKILELAIKRMLPKGPLGRKMFKKLHVYAGVEHPHQAQQPQSFELAL